MFLFSIFSEKGEISEIQKQPPQVFYKKSCTLKFRKTPKVFPCEYCKISKNTYNKEHLQTVATGDTQGIIVKLMKICIMKAQIL